MNSLYIVFFIIIMLGLWMFLWSIWGGEIRVKNNVPGNEVGLGLNPPKIEK